MKFYVATNSHERLYKNWFGRSIYQIQLISIAIISERGERFYAISDDINIRSMSRGEAMERLDEIYAEGNDYNILKIKELRWRLIEFINREAQGEFAEFLGYKCYKDFTLLASLFGGIEHPEYPSNFSDTITDLHQSVNDHVSNMGSYDFFLGSPHELFISKLPGETYTHEEKVTMFKTHFLYPKKKQSKQLINKAFYVKEMADFLTKVKCYSPADLREEIDKNV